MKSDLKCFKTLNRGVIWPTRVYQVACGVLEGAETLENWGDHHLVQEGDRKQSGNYRGIYLLRLPRKVYVKCLEKSCRKIIVPKLEDIQCCLRPGRNTTDQIFLSYKV